MPLTEREGRIIDDILAEYKPSWINDRDVPDDWQAMPTPQIVPQRDWRDDPATGKQINYLRYLGHDADFSMTKGEAATLIADLLVKKERS